MPVPTTRAPRWAVADGGSTFSRSAIACGSSLTRPNTGASAVVPIQAATTRMMRANRFIDSMIAMTGPNSAAVGEPENSEMSTVARFSRIVRAIAPNREPSMSVFFGSGLAGIDQKMNMNSTQPRPSVSRIVTMLSTGAAQPGSWNSSAMNDCRPVPITVPAIVSPVRMRIPMSVPMFVMTRTGNDCLGISSMSAASCERIASLRLPMNPCAVYSAERIPTMPTAFQLEMKFVSIAAISSLEPSELSM